jgi:hypothetical protein
MKKFFSFLFFFTIAFTGWAEISHAGVFVNIEILEEGVSYIKFKLSGHATENENIDWDFAPVYYEVFDQDEYILNGEQWLGEVANLYFDPNSPNLEPLEIDIWRNQYDNNLISSLSDPTVSDYDPGVFEGTNYEMRIHIGSWVQDTANINFLPSLGGDPDMNLGLAEAQEGFIVPEVILSGFTPGLEKTLFIDIREGQNILEEPVGPINYLFTGDTVVVPSEEGEVVHIGEPISIESLQENASVGANSFILRASVAGLEKSLLITTDETGIPVLLTPTTNPNNCTEGGGTYCLLEPIGTNSDQITKVNVETTFGSYLNAIFQIGVAMAGVFGVLLIVIGGITYMTSDVITKKSEGRDQIKKAILGVFLALMSWLLLNTIDFGLVDFEVGVYDNVSQQSGVVSNNLDNGSSSTCQAIASGATTAANNNLSTCNAPGTNGGNLACAWLVDTLIHQATGSYIGGSTGPQTYTPSLLSQLQGNSNYSLLGSINAPVTNNTQASTLAQSAQAGDIIISPTIPNQAVGHVGICVSGGCSSIVSNSSSQQAAAQNFTFSNWVTNYTNNNLYIFRHSSCS